MNTVAVMGRLVNDVELKTSKDGVSVVSFAIAVNRGKDLPVDFFTVVAWRQTAEFISRHFHKGKLIGITGHLQQRKFEDAKGEKRQVVEIVAEKVSFCGDKDKSEDFTPVNDSEELPFT